ncbi:MAG TPA: hypothetical protein VFK23_07980 [Nitrospirota bacterium]|nr:hypothetical protein [Nitrospirota bacterium]
MTRPSAVAIVPAVRAAAVAAAFTVPVAPAMLVLGFIFYLLLAFGGPAAKFRFSSSVISCFSRSPVVTRLHLRRMFRSNLCYLRGLGFLGFFRPCLCKRASAANDKAGEKCDG